MLIALFVLTVATCFALRGRSPIVRRIFAPLGFALIFLIGNGALAGWLVNSLQAGWTSIGVESFGNRATIILLGGGLDAPTANESLAEPSMWGQGRITRTAALYRQCKSRAASCSIIVSGGDPRA